MAGAPVEAVPRPLLPPAIPQFFAPIQRGRPAGASLVYLPMLFGSAQVRFVDRKAGVDTTQDAVWLTPITEVPVPVNWDEAREAGFGDAELAREAGEEAAFGALAGKAAKPASYDGWSRDFAAWLARTQKATFLRSPSTGELSRPGEDERAFRIRLQQLGRERRDEQKERLQARYAPKAASLTERLRRAELAVAREAEQANAQKMQAAISIGATLLGSLFGRRAVSAGTIGRATTAARGVGRAMKESGDIGRARESVEAIRAQLEELEAEFQAELQSLETRTDPLTEILEPVALSPLRKDIAVRLVALAWAPHWRDASGGLAPAW